MKATIRPTRLKGSILAPASKSSMQRACAAADFVAAVVSHFADLVDLAVAFAAGPVYFEAYFAWADMAAPAVDFALLDLKQIVLIRHHLASVLTVPAPD